MVFLSKILYFISHHGFYTTLILILFFLTASYLTKKIWVLILIIPFSVANGVCSQYLNAWFLNKYGVKSNAIITSDIETTSTLNDQYIHDYEAIVRKQDGKYVSTSFSSTFATVYPIENAIHIPRMSKTFPVKYIVGYEENMVILYNEYEEGQKLLRYEKQAPIISARMKYEADKTNKDFIEGYIAALKGYTETYQDKNSEKYNHLIRELQQELDGLK